MQHSALKLLFFLLLFASLVVVACDDDGDKEEGDLPDDGVQEVEEDLPEDLPEDLGESDTPKDQVETSEDVPGDSPEEVQAEDLVETAEDLVEDHGQVDTAEDLVEDTGPVEGPVEIVLLHHSTGGVIWNGGVPEWFEAYNQSNQTQYHIVEQAFPKSSPYGWQNYPYDYWNIWVANAGNEPYMEEPTLEILTADYDVVVFKHCYPVSNIQEDTGSPDISSSAKRAENYKLQYAALKEAMNAFPETQFVVWTGAARIESETNPAEAQRARDFFAWVRDEWDVDGDNIFLWDFDTLETEGGLYLLEAYSSGDSHPNSAFAEQVAPYLSQRLVDVIEGRGDSTSLTGN